jgi:hypothetical protein
MKHAGQSHKFEILFDTSKPLTNLLVKKDLLFLGN